jgi:hypothetical protein
MIVRLTPTMLIELLRSALPLHQEWIDNTLERISDRVVEAAMPPIGWKTLSDRVVERAFTPRGFRKGGKEVAGAGLRRINRELAHLEAHPALRGQAMPGIHSDYLLVWGTSPYPQRDMEPAVLVPEVRQFRGMVVTAWKAQYRPASTVTDERLLQPGAHWDFIRPADTPASTPDP